MSRSSATALLVPVATALLLVACGQPDNARPGVVLIVIDQLRKDAADSELTEVNALATRGVVVEEMRAAAPWTYPSVVSLLTGLYPQQHGADASADGAMLSHIDPGLPFIQTRLQEAGYATAAFVTNPFLLEWNAVHTGFEEFETGFIGTQGDRLGYPQAWARQTMFADNVNKAVFEWFDARAPDQPEFSYVHYIDVHGPWEDAPFEGGYGSSIRYIDSKVVELYQYFNQRYGGDLLFFVTSDHGRALAGDLAEGFGPEVRHHKKSVHEFNLRIPFMVLPGERVPTARVSGTASAVDFVPTLLDWLDLAASVDRPGISLLPAIESGEPIRADRASYARNAGFGSVNDGLVRGGRKYLRAFDPSTGEVMVRRIFDLTRDPRETVSLGDDFGEEGPVLDEAAGTHGLAFDAEYRGIDTAVAERLRALGYLGGPEPPME